MKRVAKGNGGAAVALSPLEQWTEAWRAKLRVQVPAERTRYWVGCRQGCPVQYLSLRGVAFHTSTEPIDEARSDEARTVRSQERGQYLELDPEQVAEVLEASIRKAFRYNRAAPGVAPKIVNLANPRRRPEPRSDEPVGAHIFMVPVDRAADQYGAEWHRHANPDAVLRTDE